MEIAHESVFVSSIRSLCKTFSGLIGIFLAIALGSFVYSIFSSPFEPLEKTKLTILPNLNDELILEPFHSPVVLRINIHGVIGEPQLDEKTVQNILLDSRRGILSNNRVKAILVDFNTPGGTVFDSDAIYRMLKSYKEKFHVPVYGYVSGLCASGGMYISAACDKMYASPSSIIGSIGVIIGPFFNVFDTLDKIGVKSKTLTDGLNKDMMSPFRPWTDNEDASLRAIIDFQYQRFVDIVTEARPQLNREKLVGEYGANVFDGVKAQQLGYVDVANTDWKEPLNELLVAANIDPSLPYQVIELEPSPSFLGMLSNCLRVEHKLDLGESKNRDQFSYLYIPGRAQ